MQSHQRMRAQEMWEYLESATSFQAIDEQDVSFVDPYNGILLFSCCCLPRRS